MTEPVKVSRKIVTHLQKRLKAWHKATPNYADWDTKAYPWIGVIGKDKRGVVRSIKDMSHRDRKGCYQMVTIYPYELSKACIEITKQGHIPCGLYRVGCFGIDEWGNDDLGTDIENSPLKSMGLILQLRMGHRGRRKRAEAITYCGCSDDYEDDLDEYDFVPVKVVK
jgi:hypothetical protein